MTRPKRAPRRGRPPRDQSGAAPDLKIRLTVEERARYEQAAGAGPLSEWARAALDRAAERKAG